jgi:Putative metal-binding motif
LVGGLAFAAGCACGTPVGQEDSGNPLTGTPCAIDSECPFGEACVEGYCGTPVTPDAGITCTRNEDCPMGQVCLPSTGECITPVDPDAGEEDGGVITGVCNPGETTSCGSSKLGRCRLGTASCTVIDGAYAYGPCVGSVEPVAELCNGLDEDCDGINDNGFPDINCGVGECRRTVPGCFNGMVSTCMQGSPSPEICDAKDNDCNGQSDDMGLAYCGTGACRRSVIACDGGVPGLCQQGTGTAETCNGIDDDCNGNVDENFAMVTCGQGVCFRSVYPCSDGGVVACVAPPGAATDNCATLDDENCNGLINDGCACTPGTFQSCYTGPPGTQGNAPCQAGQQACDGGQWGPCSGQVLPVTEACNTVDDNCNGTPDDLGSTTCGTGVCRITVQNCASGTPQACNPPDGGAEVCNALDDDCDGQSDEGIANIFCGVGACYVNVPACNPDGGPATCMPGVGTPEVCNGVDDDCVGGVDNGIGPAGCSTGQPGICAAGFTSCSSGVTVCVRMNNPVAEICNNGQDDDCNGTVDIGPGCCDAGVDLDFDGYDQCRDCVDTNGAVNPDAGERCNGYDDNCRLGIDEGFDKDNDGFTVCGTMDAGGVDVRRIDCNDDAGFVFPLKTVDCGQVVPNTPNGVDDNCNGYVDETCGCNPALDSDGDGVNDCLDCVDNDNTIYPGRLETCDGKDNDCNRLTIDNCGVSQPCAFNQPGPSTPAVPYPAGTDQCRPDLICATNVATNDKFCGSYCNQTAGLGLNDSCLTNQACDLFLIDADKLNLCSEYPAWSGPTPIGGACTADTQCATHNCRADTSAIYCTDNCNHESACPGSTFCHVQNLQTDRQGNNYWYAYGAQCRLGSQIAGTGLQGGTCTADSQCRSGVCFQGRCAEPCCAHADCVGGSTCGIGPTQLISNGGSQISMVPVCRFNTGARPSGAACTANADCRSRICDTLQGVCMDICCNDSSCGTPGQSCEPVSVRIPDGGLIDIVRGCVFSPVPTQIRMPSVP